MIASGDQASDEPNPHLPQPRLSQRNLSQPNLPEPHLAAPHLGELVVSAEDLQRRVHELGVQVTRDYRDRPPLLVGVLKGACFFLSDLARAVRLPVGIDFMAVSSYGSATRTSGVVRILKDLELDLPGRH